MPRLAPVALIAFAVLGISSARAEEPPLPAPIPAAEQKTLEQFGAAEKACAEWSDGCVVCVRQTNGSAACSLPGIACEPKAPTCREVSEKKPAETPASPGAK